MRAGHRTEYQDQHDQHRAGRQRVAEQRERLISARQLLRHDARADHGREQKRRAERPRQQGVAKAVASGRFRGLRRGAFHAADLLQPRLQADSWSRLRIGSAANIAMR